MLILFQAVTAASLLNQPCGSSVARDCAKGLVCQYPPNNAVRGVCRPPVHTIGQSCGGNGKIPASCEPGLVCVPPIIPNPIFTAGTCKDVPRELGQVCGTQLKFGNACKKGLVCVRNRCQAPINGIDMPCGGNIRKTTPAPRCENGLECHYPIMNAKVPGIQGKCRIPQSKQDSACGGLGKYAPVCQSGLVCVYDEPRRPGQKGVCRKA